MGSQDITEEGPIGGELEEVSGHVTQATTSRSDKAMLWNSGSDLIDGDVWDLKLVPVRIQQGPVPRGIQLALGYVLVELLCTDRLGCCALANGGELVVQRLEIEWLDGLI